MMTVDLKGLDYSQVEMIQDCILDAVYTCNHIPTKEKLQDLFMVVHKELEEQKKENVKPLDIMA